MRAAYDESLEANWIELSISSNVYFPERNPKKSYVYVYTLKLWDGNLTADAAGKGALGELLFGEDRNLNAVVSSTESVEDILEGIEKYQWKEYLGVADPSDKNPKQNNKVIKQYHVHCQNH